MSERPGTVLALVDNLFFASKIEHAARAAGANVVLAADASSFRAELGRVHPGLVLMDMAGSFPWQDLLRELKANPSTGSVPVLAFGRHTRAEDFKVARRAGCEQAITNAQLAEQLPALIRQYLDGATGKTEPASQ